MLKAMVGKPRKDCFLLRRHSIFLGDAAGGDVLGMDKGEDAEKAKLAEGVIADSAGGLGGETAIPGGGIKAISDFEFFDVVDGLGEEAAGANEALMDAVNHCELGRQASAITGANFFEKRSGLLARENTERETHEILVGHQLRDSVEVGVGERAKEEARCFNRRHGALRYQSAAASSTSLENGCTRQRRVERTVIMATKFVARNERDWIPAPTPDTSSLAKLKEAARSCTACHLFRHATQTVFGEGRKGAKLMLLGEQPGDQEDLAGKPFVGPAGKILDRALEEAGIDRRRVYVTNTVKHFKWEPRGKRRIHKKPNSREIAACRPWLEAELRVIGPGLLVCLGATAAQAIFGPAFRVTRERGKVLATELAPKVLATVHPSSLLRQPDEESREREYKHFVADLRVALRAAE
jgi:uracil-DNA glycosylase family protein